MATSTAHPSDDPDEPAAEGAEVPPGGSQPATVADCAEPLVGLCPPLAAEVKAWYEAHESGWQAVADDVAAHVALIERADREGPGVLQGHCGDLLPAAATVRSWAPFPEADGRRYLSEAARLMEFIDHTCGVDLELGVTGNAAGTAVALYDYLRFTEAAFVVAYAMDGQDQFPARYP